MSVFDLPMTARPGKDAIAGQDELGRTVYRTVTGERYTMPERTEMPAPTMGQRFENLGGLASRAYENLSVQGAIDAAKGLGEGIVSGIVQGFTAPGRALSGEPVSFGDVMATAGMAQVGAAPMRAPAGSLRSGAISSGRPPVTFDDVARAMDEGTPAAVPPVTMQGAYDNLISYNEQVRKGKGMLDRDKVSGGDNVLYRPDRAYRFIGPEGYDDFLKSGLIRAKTGSKQGYEVPFFMKGQSSGRYGGGEGGKYMVETIPDSNSWRGAAQEFDADKYVAPSSPITKESPIRIFERGEDGQYRVIFDNIGDDAFLPAQSPQ